MKQGKHYSYIFITAAIVFTAVVFFADIWGMFRTTQLRISDRLQPERPASSDILLVTIDDKSIQEYGVWPWPRSLHARMIDRLTADGVETIGYDVTFAEASTDQEDSVLEQALRDSGKVVLASEPGLLPLERFREYAQYGLTTLYLDSDGIARRAPTKGTFASMILGMHDSFAVLHVPFVGPPGSFTHVSFYDLLDGTFAGELPSTVLIGSTAEDLHDAFVVPTSKGERMSGVEVQANIFQALDEGITLQFLSSAQKALLYLCLMALLMVLGLWLRLRYLIISLIGVLFLYFFVVVAVASTHLLFPVFYPVLLIVGIGAIDLAYRYLKEKHRRGWVQHAFGHYLAPQVIEQIIAGETKLELGGVKKELSILFSDIRGFTSMSEKLDPEELVSLLNEYLTAMTELVLESGGVIDKYIGDAVMAFWGAPLDFADHADRAVDVAVKMKQRLDELNKQWEKEGRPSLDIGIGVNTAEVIVGNMGSKQRFDYTLIGDGVNLAARLESLNKQYTTHIIISAFTKEKLTHHFSFKDLGEVTVKGKSKPVEIFEVIPE